MYKQLKQLLSHNAEFFPQLNQVQKDHVIGLFSNKITSGDQLKTMLLLSDQEMIDQESLVDGNPADKMAELGQQKSIEYYELNNSSGKDKSSVTYCKLSWLRKQQKGGQGAAKESLAFYGELRTKNLLSSSMLFKLDREHMF